MWLDSLRVRRPWFEATTEMAVDLKRAHDEPLQPQQLVASHPIITISDEDAQRGMLVGMAGAGAVIILAVAVLLGLALRARKHGRKLGDNEAPGIVVYPSQQGDGPQFWTKEIQFSLPPLRHAASLGDLLGVEGSMDPESDHDTDSLVPPGAMNAHSQRSNSFSCYGLGVIDPALYRESLSLEERDNFPDNHLGRLWFSVRYEPATEKLLVSLLKAKNLPSRTVGTVNACDPFVRLHLMPDERRYLQSKQKKKTCNPYFDETFVFQVASKQLSDHILKMTVVDSGRTKRRSIIGHVTLPLRDLPSEVADQQLYKLDLEKEAQELVRELGELLVSLVYNENLHRLTVTVIEARRLKLREERGSSVSMSQDTYVRVSLLQNYRSVKVKKTATVRGAGDSPNFSEGFNFRIPAAQVDISSISLQVLQPVPGYGRDKLIGKLVLGSFMFARGRALEHWNAAFSSPMEQIQQWHSLCE